MLRAKGVVHIYVAGHRAIFTLMLPHSNTKDDEVRDKKCVKSLAVHRLAPRFLNPSLNLYLAARACLIRLCGARERGLRESDNGIGK